VSQRWGDRPELFEVFRGEAADRLASMSEGLLALEAAGVSLPVLERISRDAHSIKGSAKLLGFTAVCEVAHAMEEVLVGLREGTRTFTSEVCDVLLDACDVLAGLVEGSSVEHSDLSTAMCERLTITDAAAFEEVAAATVTAPPASDPVPDAPVPAVEPAADPATTAGAAIETDAEVSHGRGATVRLETAKVYDLIDAVGESTIGQVTIREQADRLGELFRRIDSRVRRFDHGVDTARADEVLELLRHVRDELSVLSYDLDDVADTSRKQVEALQERAMALATFPAATVMAPLPRLARDLCRELSKQASLVVDDGDVELDKQVLERIAEPLRALVINALDHGVESPDERSAAGKDPTATVSITARQRGGQVVIEVSDDGRGVDVDAVRRRGVAAGWLSGEEEISAADLGGLLFRPGFSTAQQSTTTSGRGVGLDIVRDAIDALKGGIEVYTEAGSGTTFVLTVPTTLSIVVGVTVVSGGRTYALPVSAVSEVVQVPADEIRTVAGRDVVDLRGEVLPLVSLSGLIGGDADREGGPVMVLSSAGRSLAVRVENLVGQREIVVKNLGSFVRGVRHVGGASILGNGEVILVLDPSSLLAAGRLGSAARVPGPSHHQAAANPRVLVVDDAAPIREMVRAILEAAGFDVTTAADGVEALAGYEHETAFDAVVSDVQMPQMDGLELCAALRERGVTVPIVMLTSLGSDDDRRRGLDAGADAYLTKADFDQVELVELLRSMVPA